MFNLGSSTPPEARMTPITRLLSLTQPLAPGDASLDELIARWLEHAEAQGASALTLEAYRRGLEFFANWLYENYFQGEVTPAILQAFKKDLEEIYKPQTINLRLAAVRSFYRFAVLQGYTPYNPAGEIKGARRHQSARHRRDPLTNSEVQAVKTAADAEREPLQRARNAAIISLMAYCGLRTIEVQRADIGHLKTLGERLVLEVQGKGRLEADEIAVIPVSQEPLIRHWLSLRLKMAQHRPQDPLFVSLSRRNQGYRLTTRAIRGLVKELYAGAGVVGGKSTHSLRHSAITNAIRHGGELLQVQAFARHKSPDTTMNYIHEVSRLDNPIEDLIDYGE
jgi:integrase/recombinase XerD